ncbi:MAG: carboxylesterase family protein [Asticcacaulis sp.]
MGTISSAIATKDVVIVSIQYRLGVFGFLSHPALTAESGVGASGNYALMDQIKALQWVQANIAQFGGDPYNVTLMGHSAGGQDVGLLLTTPLARGLFQKAIEESGTPQFGFSARTLAQNEAMGVALAGQFSHAAPNSAQALADLRAALARDLQTAGDKLQAPLEDQSFIWDQATVDGYVLPRAPEEVFRAGEAAKVPLLIGVSARELTLADVSADYNKALAARFGASAGVVDAHDGHDDPLYGDRVMQLSTDILLRCPADWIARHMAGPVYLYQLDVDRDGVVHHSSELNFVMNARPAGKDDGAWPPLARLLDAVRQNRRAGRQGPG